MPYVDKQNLVSDAQALSGAASTVSTDAIALGVAGLDVAAGEPMGFTFQVDVAADAGDGDETYEFQIVTATASDLTTGQDIILSEAVARASLTAGAKFTLPVPLGRIASTATHIGARYVLGGTSPSITMTTFLQPIAQVQSNRAPFRSGFTVAS